MLTDCLQGYFEGEKKAPWGEGAVQIKTAKL